MTSQIPESICDERIYNRIYENEVVKLRNFIYYKCGDLDMAEDVAQETFVKLWLNCASVGLSTAIGFLHTVAKRIFIDQTRNDQVRLKFEKEPFTSSNAEDPYFLLRTEEFRELIEQAISDLPEGQREVFLMNRMDQYTFKEIAERLEISTTAVENRMHKALTKLRGKIEEFKSYKI